MKTAGIIGGIGPESTIEYYRFIIEGYRQRITDGSYPSIILNSIDLNKLVAWMNRSELDAAAEYLLAEIERVARASADFAAIAANTPHIVFDRLRSRSTLRLISIVEATRDQAHALGLKRLGLIGTRFTMQATFYQSAFADAGLTIAVPNENEQALIHEKYFNELVRNIFLPETRDRLLAIVDRMKADEAIEGLILGGTELPLILRREDHNGVTFLDTTRIHCERIVEQLVS
jgi:aspartate racemase